MKPKSTKIIDKKWSRTQRYIKRKANEEWFARVLYKVYHAEGHLAIGEDCKNKPEEDDSAMSFSEVSARDPIFYRSSSTLFSFTQLVFLCFVSLTKQLEN